MNAREKLLSLIDMLAEEELEALNRYAQEIIKINALQEPMRQIMRLRRIDGLKWEEVADRTYYTLRRVAHYAQRARKIIGDKA